MVNLFGRKEQEQLTVGGYNIDPRTPAQVSHDFARNFVGSVGNALTFPDLGQAWLSANPETLLNNPQHYWEHFIYQVHRALMPDGVMLTGQSTTYPINGKRITELTGYARAVIENLGGPQFAQRAGDFLRWGKHYVWSYLAEIRNYSRYSQVQGYLMPLLNLLLNDQALLRLSPDLQEAIDYRNQSVLLNQTETNRYVDECAQLMLDENIGAVARHPNLSWQNLVNAEMASITRTVLRTGNGQPNAVAAQFYNAVSGTFDGPRLNATLTAVGKANGIPQDQVMRRVKDGRFTNWYQNLLLSTRQQVLPLAMPYEALVTTGKDYFAELLARYDAVVRTKGVFPDGYAETVLDDHKLFMKTVVAVREDATDTLLFVLDAAEQLASRIVVLLGDSPEANSDLAARFFTLFTELVDPESDFLTKVADREIHFGGPKQAKFADGMQREVMVILEKYLPRIAKAFGSWLSNDAKKPEARAAQLQLMLVAAARLNLRMTSNGSITEASNSLKGLRTQIWYALDKAMAALSKPIDKVSFAYAVNLLSHMMLIDPVGTTRFLHLGGLEGEVFKLRTRERDAFDKAEEIYQRARKLGNSAIPASPAVLAMLGAGQFVNDIQDRPEIEIPAASRAFFRRIFPEAVSSKVIRGLHVMGPGRGIIPAGIDPDIFLIKEPGDAAKMNGFFEPSHSHTTQRLGADANKAASALYEIMYDDARLIDSPHEIAAFVLYAGTVILAPEAGMSEEVKKKWRGKLISKITKVLIAIAEDGGMEANGKMAAVTKEAAIEALRVPLKLWPASEIKVLLKHLSDQATVHPALYKTIDGLLLDIGRTARDQNRVSPEVSQVVLDTVVGLVNGYHTAFKAGRFNHASFILGTLGVTTEEVKSERLELTIAAIKNAQISRSILDRRETNVLAKATWFKGDVGEPAKAKFDADLQTALQDDIMRIIKWLFPNELTTEPVLDAELVRSAQDSIARITAESRKLIQGLADEDTLGLKAIAASAKLSDEDQRLADQAEDAYKAARTKAKRIVTNTGLKAYIEKLEHDELGGTGDHLARAVDTLRAVLQSIPTTNFAYVPPVIATQVVSGTTQQAATSQPAELNASVANVAAHQMDAAGITEAAKSESQLAQANIEAMSSRADARATFIRAEMEAVEHAVTHMQALLQSRDAISHLSEAQQEALAMRLEQMAQRIKQYDSSMGEMAIELNTVAQEVGKQALDVLSGTTEWVGQVRPVIRSLVQYLNREFNGADQDRVKLREPEMDEIARAVGADWLAKAIDQQKTYNLPLQLS